jgi:hypothetical protein
MADQVRLQVRKNNTENSWADVGNKTGNESIPVTFKETIPTDSTNLNPSTEYDYSDPSSIVITETIGLDVYQQTITISATTATESAWIKL